MIQLGLQIIQNSLQILDQKSLMNNSLLIKILIFFNNHRIMIQIQIKF